MGLSLSQFRTLEALAPDVGLRAYYLLSWLRYYGARVRVSEGLRSAERQQQLYAQGRTSPGRIVTWTLQSKHLTGHAFDIDFEGYHPDEVPPAWWNFAGAVGEYLGLTWGGRWPTPDKRHFER